MNTHKSHNVLGEYCWTCQRPTSTGIPSWPKRSSSDGPKEKMVPIRVIWKDGGGDTNRRCDTCLRWDCQYPSHSERERYGIRTTRIAGQSDVANPVI